MSDYTVETINLSPLLRIRIEYDTDAQEPESDIVKITYRDSSRYTLGTEGVSDDERDALQERWNKGEIIALPVYAYVHGRATIRCAQSNPFKCQWDSGQSGIAYMTRKDALENWGKKILTAKVREAAYACIRAVVEEFDQYLTGDVYGYIVETRESEDDDWEHADSCWGFFGREYVKEEAMSVANYHAKQQAKEVDERAYWASRDVMTC